MVLQRETFYLQAKKCKIVENAPKVQEFGNKSRVTVDAREAGDGAVTCKIISDTGRYEFELNFFISFI